MKLFDVDWTSVLRDLSHWWTLPFAARRVLLSELKPHGYVPAQRFGDHLALVVESGIPRFDAKHNRVWVGEERRELVKVLRAMDRHRVFDAPEQETLIKYLEDHFTNADIEVLGTDIRTTHPYVTRQLLAARIAFGGWAEDLLAARGDKALAAWAGDRGWAAIPAGDNRSVEDVLDSLFGPNVALPPTRSISSLKSLQVLARRLLTAPNGVVLRDLIAERQRDAVPSLADALYAGLATGVVFAGMRGVDLEPMVGLWPGAARELTRPPAKLPTAVIPVEQFSLAVGMEDLTTVLAAVVAAPVRVRANDLAVFARTRTAIETRLVAPPPWAAHLFANNQLTRVDEAARELELHRFVQIREQDGNPHLTATANGKRWLALTPHDRLASLIDPARTSTEENPRGAYDVPHAASFFPFTLPYLQVPKSLQLRRALTSAFLDSANAFIPLEDFLDHAAREANPFFALPRSAAAHIHSFTYSTAPQDPRESYRNLWQNMLGQFLVVRLCRLGGATVGRLENGSLCFALTDAGRYLLGAEKDFAYGAAGVTDIVVQPNFDVVFLGTAPSTEATIARFAERAGVAPGLTFRITRASVLSAAEAGATAEELLDSLRRASSKPIPKNVEKEIVGWIGAVRRARLRVIEVIDCEGGETADRIATLIGPKAQRLSPTVFELPAGTPSARAALVKRLKGGGVFLEDATMRVSPKSSRRRLRMDESWEDEDDDA